MKPLSAAITVGAGGPFGAEGPIISTGGAIGFFCGQTLDDLQTELDDSAKKPCYPSIDVYFYSCQI